MAGSQVQEMVTTTVKKTIKGKKVNALRVGEGAGNYFVSYAYQNKKFIK